MPTPPTTPPQILVIGAGAAGIAAARRLHDAGYSVTVLEARPRIGGRTLTDTTLAPHPVELGAEFIHGDQVITWGLLKSLGLTTLPAPGDEAYLFREGRMIRYEEGVVALEMKERFAPPAKTWLETGKPDAPLSTFLDDSAALPLDEPLTEEERAVANNLIAADFAADLHRLGIYGFAELSYAGDGTGNFRVQEGYSAFFNRLAEGLNILTEQVITHIEWGAGGVKVTAENGNTYSGEAAVITLPLGVLQAGGVTFTPELPASKQAAIAGVGAGHVDKVVLRFQARFWAEDAAFLCTALPSSIWWQPGFMRPNNAPVLTALIGGEGAERLEALAARSGEAAVIEAALNDLIMMYPEQPVRDWFIEGRFINWGGDPFSHMGYSYGKVGGFGLREVLAAPLEGVLFFAGEATHTTRAATVHGALESGFRAAEEVMAR